MWFFEGFCKFLKPKYCTLIDVGTVPSEDGLVNYFRGMEADGNIGGLSGYMGLYFDETKEYFDEKWKIINQNRWKINSKN